MNEKRNETIKRNIINRHAVAAAHRTQVLDSAPEYTSMDILRQLADIRKCIIAAGYDILLPEIEKIKARLIGGELNPKQLRAIVDEIKSYETALHMFVQANKNYSDRKIKMNQK